MSVATTVSAARSGESSATISISGAVDSTLTIEQLGFRSLVLTGALTANVNVFLPATSSDIGSWWIITNSTSGAFTLTVKNTTGTGVVIASAKTACCKWDGTNIVPFPTDATAAGFAKSGANTDLTSISLTAGATIAGGLNLSGNLGGNSATPAPLSYGRLSLSVAGSANVTLSASQYANPILEFTGLLTGNISVFVPLTAGAEWQVYNGTTGSFTLTMIGATGTGVVVTQGQRQRITCDGTNVYGAVADVPTLAIGNGTVATKLQVLTATYDPASLSANTTREDSVTVTGITTADKILAVIKPTHTTGFVIGNARASASNTVAVTVGNVTTGAVDAPSETYTFVALRS
jgi:hypothetical protein